MSVVTCCVPVEVADVRTRTAAEDEVAKGANANEDTCTTDAHPTPNATPTDRYILLRWAFAGVGECRG